MELDPVSAFRVIEELARIDSAAGWNIAIANASEPFGAWFPDDASEEDFWARNYGDGRCVQSTASCRAG